MTPEQALQLLDEAAQRAPGTRQEHIMWQQSVQVLSNAIIELQGLRARENAVSGQNFEVVEDPAEE